MSLTHPCKLWVHINGKRVLEVEGCFLGITWEIMVCGWSMDWVEFILGG